MVKNPPKKNNSASSSSHDPLQQYMKEISKIRLLSRDEEIKIAKAAEASSDKTWELSALMEKGEALYNTNCAACHKPDGSGTQPVFPALKGSAIALGDVSKHLDIIIKGASGTAMAAWGTQLNDLEIAAIATYERNAWGNNTGDAVQPADVKAAR